MVLGMAFLLESDLGSCHWSNGGAGFRQRSLSSVASRTAVQRDPCADGRKQRETGAQGHHEPEAVDERGADRLRSHPPLRPIDLRWNLDRGEPGFLAVNLLAYRGRHFCFLQASLESR